MAAILSLLALPLAVKADVAATATTSTFSFKPTAGTSWNIQLKTPPPASAADNANYHVWDYDLFDTTNETVQAFHAKNHPVICYFSAGSFEDWRPDVKKFPESALGKPLDGWEGERWLDTRNGEVRKIMADRIAMAKATGCDGVDPDNIDGYSNDTGFDLTEEDGIGYVKFLADTAHAAGMAYGLKNGGDIIESVVDYAEWVVNEQCVQYSECSQYQPFIKANKPVFNLEYTEKNPAPADFVSKSCNDPDAKGFSTLIKHLNLSDWTTTCPNAAADSTGNKTSSASPSATPTITASKSGSPARLTSSITVFFSSVAVLGLASLCGLL